MKILIFSNTFQICGQKHIETMCTFATRIFF
nr:MAG TPA: hypothetical protein [Caudoviricetes sp.]